MAAEAPALDDQTPARRDELRRLLHGLAQPQKWISSMYFYDAAGAALFDRITALPEYYLTRVELAIMRRQVGEMAAALGPDAMVLEPGSGAGEKIRLLLRALASPVAYVPIEIARDHLEASVQTLAREFPALELLPVWGDFTASLDIPLPARGARRRAVFFPGSTIGNFEPADAAALLGNFAAMSGPGGAALIGVDMAKDPAMIEAAYNDADGITAAFNLNMLANLNRRFGANFDTAAFEHLAFYNGTAGRIEMHLKSRRRQTVRFDGEEILFAPGETIHTESSYKYTDEGFAALVAKTPFRLERSWKDPDNLFSLRYLARD